MVTSFDQALLDLDFLNPLMLAGHKKVIHTLTNL